MNQTTSNLVALLAQLAYREGDFELSSGRRSSFYLDAKKVTYDPDGFQLAGQAVLDRLHGYDVQAVGGLTLGADALVCSTVGASVLRGSPMPGFIVRKEPKGHGLKKWIEGVCPAPGTRVAIVDDVVTSGKSVLRAVEAAREAGLNVTVVVPLVDREEGGADAVLNEGIAYAPICTLTDVRRASGSASLAAARA